jgi:hypothetical protein
MDGLGRSPPTIHDCHSWLFDGSGGRGRFNESAVDGRTGRGDGDNDCADHAPERDVGRSISTMAGDAMRAGRR